MMQQPPAKMFDYERGKVPPEFSNVIQLAVIASQRALARNLPLKRGIPTGIYALGMTAVFLTE